MGGVRALPFFYRFLKAEQNSQQADKAKVQMLAGLLFCAVMSSKGPFSAGDTLMAVDIAFAPLSADCEFAGLVLLRHA